MVDDDIRHEMQIHPEDNPLNDSDSLEDKWREVNPDEIEVWKSILREEGVLEEELENELEKLMVNARVSSTVRAVLITPEVDSALRKIFDFAIFGGVCSATKNEFELIEEALWQK